MNRSICILCSFLQAQLSILQYKMHFNLQGRPNNNFVFELSFLRLEGPAGPISNWKVERLKNILPCISINYKWFKWIVFFFQERTTKRRSTISMSLHDDISRFSFFLVSWVLKLNRLPDY